MQALGSDVELTRTTVFNIFAKFLYVFGASLVVGLTFGLGTAVLLKLLKSNSAPQVRVAFLLSQCRHMCWHLFYATGCQKVLCSECVTVWLSCMACVVAKLMLESS